MAKAASIPPRILPDADVNDVCLEQLTYLQEHVARHVSGDTRCPDCRRLLIVRGELLGPFVVSAAGQEWSRKTKAQAAHAA